MSHPLLTALKKLLRDVESTQAEHLQLLQRKRKALRAAQTEELLQIAALEEDVVGRMRGLVSERQQLLRQASVGGTACETLLDLAERHGADEVPKLRERIQRVRLVSAGIQRENHIQWIVAKSVDFACEGLIELMMHQGTTAPIYGKAPRSGALLLDSTV